MGLAIFRPWNWVLVAAVIVCSGPLTVAAVCTSIFSAAVLLVVAGAIVVHALFTSAYQVCTSMPLSGPAHPHNGHHPTSATTAGAMTTHQVSPLLVMQGGPGVASRSRGSRRSSFSQRSGGGSLPSLSSSPASTSLSNNNGVGSVGSSATSTYSNGGVGGGGGGSGGGFSGFGGFSSFASGPGGISGGGAGVNGAVGGSLCSSKSSSSGSGNGNGNGDGRRYSLIATLSGDGLDGYYGDEDHEVDGRYYNDVDDDEDWPSDLAGLAQHSSATLSRHMLHRSGDSTPKLRRDSQGNGFNPSPPSLSYLLSGSGIRGVGVMGPPFSSPATSGVPLPIASNSSRRRASSIGGIPSLVRAGSSSASASHSGASTPWRRPRHRSDVGL